MYFFLCDMNVLIYRSVVQTQYTSAGVPAVVSEFARKPEFFGSSSGYLLLDQPSLL